MTDRFTRRQALALGGMAGLAPLMPKLAFGQDKLAGLPDTMIWSTYDVGSTGYVEASAVADALIKKYGTRVRLLPSGSGIGRILPLKKRQAATAWLANELYFATRGLYEFSQPQWGPQDMRVLCGRPSTYGITVTQESGIKTLADLKGKRFAYSAANPSISVKNDALLAAAGFTRDDVKVVEFPSYADALRSLIEGKADAVGSSSTSAVLYELAESPRGIGWVELDPNDDKIWSAMDKVAPIFAPYKETIGAGLSEDKPANLAAYRYPMVTVYADADAEMTYSFLKAFDETFPDYKDAAPIMKRWAIDQSGTIPQDAPFHEGAVKYLKEKGVWDDKAQSWNDKRVKQLKALQGSWAKLTAKSDMGEDAFQKAWAEERDGILSEG